MEAMSTKYKGISDDKCRDNKWREFRAEKTLSIPRHSDAIGISLFSNVIFTVASIVCLLPQAVSVNRFGDRIDDYQQHDIDEGELKKWPIAVE